MTSEKSIGTIVRQSREMRKLTQTELAARCNLNLRTIQRIENDQIKPRLYTLKILGEALEIDFSNVTNQTEEDQLNQLREVFLRRKKLRLLTFGITICVLMIALVLLLTGIPKHLWAPFIYIVIFADLAGIVLTWRCPGCNSLLGDPFSLKYCSKCGLSFNNEIK